MNVDTVKARRIIDEMEAAQWAACEAEVRAHAATQLPALCVKHGIFDVKVSHAMLERLIEVARLGFGAGFAAGLNNHDDYMARCFKECVS